MNHTIFEKPLFFGLLAAFAPLLAAASPAHAVSDSDKIEVVNLQSPAASPSPSYPRSTALPAASASPTKAAPPKAAAAKSKRGEEPKLLGKYGGWTAYSANDGGQPVCYMMLNGMAGGANKRIKRGDPALTITHRPTESVSDEISYTAGIRLSPTADVAIKADKKPFSLFSQGDSAWSRDAVSDHALAFAIRDGGIMSVAAVTNKGDKISDQFSLSGSDNAYKAISKACGVHYQEIKKPAPKEAKVAKEAKDKKIPLKTAPAKKADTAKKTVPTTDKKPVPSKPQPEKKR